ncbi:MAG: carboxy terminal-processing peptidase [Simkaniaceae bacterium]
MEEIFSYHVENRELTPLVVRRALKVYIEQFDPTKIYLLKEEVRPFLELTDGQVEAIIYRYNHDDFSDFITLNQVIENAILRAQAIRADSQKKIMEDAKAVGKKTLGRYIDYASSESELQKRIYAEQLAWIEYESSQLPSLKISKDSKEKIFQLWERKKKPIEKSYLYSSAGSPLDQAKQEHYLVMHILKALARSLDAHTAYYSPQEAYEIRTSLKKQMEGIGVVLRESIEGVYISEVVPGGPAEKSGLVRAGDIVLSIDGKALSDVPFETIAESMKGSAGSRISLTLLRKEKNASRKVEVKLTREKIIMEGERLSYSSEPFADGIIGKIDLPSFYDNGEGVTAEKDLKNAIRALKKEGKLLGIVIDLRENSGGFLTQAVNIASLFIPQGIIVISKYADGEIRYARDIDGRIFFDGPVVLLTSKASASASEIVAQALQDYGVAIVVGDSRTYGKGSMQYQTITDEKAKAFYKVTVGRYYTASGRSTQIEGVQADIHVPTKYSFYNIGERYLEFPLSSDAIEFSLFENLKDIDQATYKVFKEEFLPFLPAQESKWQKMIADLKSNSQARLEKDQNFQYFLHGKSSSEKLHELIKQSNPNAGKDDLQMKESVNIVKDMILMDQERVSAAK